MMPICHVTPAFVGVPDLLHEVSSHLSIEGEITSCVRSEARPFPIEHTEDGVPA
jgi:hypothetical protein